MSLMESLDQFMQQPVMQQAIEKSSADRQAVIEKLNREGRRFQTMEEAQAYQSSHPGTVIDNNENLGMGLVVVPQDAFDQYLQQNVEWTRQNQEQDRNGLSGLAQGGMDMKGGLSILAAPFLAGAGGGAEAGSGGFGVGGSGTAGEFGSELAFGGGDVLSGGAGSEFLSGGGLESGGGAGDTLGEYNINPNTGDVYSAGDNPFGGYKMNPDTGDFYGTGDAPPGTDPSLWDQAKGLAKQYGISPTSALTLAKQGFDLFKKVAPAALGAKGAKDQADSLNALADKYMALGAPSRARYEASFMPGFTMANDPGYMDSLDQSSKATLHGLSVQGNPAGSPNAWAQSLQDNYAKTAYPALQNFRNTNANAGGIASLQTAAPGAATGAINAQKGVYDAIGAGFNDVFNPKQTLAEQLAELRKQGLY